MKLIMNDGKAYNEHRPYPARSRRYAALALVNADSPENDAQKRTRQNRNVAKRIRRARVGK